MDELIRLKDEMIRALQNENETLKHRNEVLEIMLKESNTQAKMLAKKITTKYFKTTYIFIYICKTIT